MNDFDKRGRKSTLMKKFKRNTLKAFKEQGTPLVPIGKTYKIIVEITHSLYNGFHSYKKQAIVIDALIEAGILKDNLWNSHKVIELRCNFELGQDLFIATIYADERDEKNKDTSWWAMPLFTEFSTTF